MSTETNSYEAVLDWLGQARIAVRSAPSANLLDFGGVDAFDALSTELYIATLTSLRSQLKPNSSSAGMYQALRVWGYRLKNRLHGVAARRHAARPVPSDFLFWPRDGTHTAMMTPVAHELRRRGASHQFLACQPATVDLLNAEGIQPVFAWHAWPKVTHRARRDGRHRASQLAASPPWQLPDLGTTPGVLLEPALRGTIRFLLPAVALAVANAREALRQIQPRVLVVGNDVTLEGHVGCQVAAQAGIPTAVYMHGVLAGNPTHRCHRADRIFVYGDIHRQQLRDYGIPQQRIVVCGNPGLDGRILQSGQTHPVLKSRLGLSDEKPWILVATSGPGNRISHKHHAAVVENLLRLARAVPRTPLVVKLHRKDRLDYYRPLLEGAGSSPVHVIRNGASGYPADILDWLQGCRLILTGSSTTAVEAMAMEVPVISMDFNNELYGIDFIDAGATAHVTDAAGLISATQQILSTGRLPEAVQSRVDEFLKVTYHALDGKSSARAAESLLELAAGAQGRGELAAPKTTLGSGI